MSTPDGLTSSTAGRVPPQEVFSDVDSGFGASIDGTYVVYSISLFISLPLLFICLLLFPPPNGGRE